MRNWITVALLSLGILGLVAGNSTPTNGGMEQIQIATGGTPPPPPPPAA